MSYLSIAACRADRDIANRITACVADESGSVMIPEDLYWWVVSRDDIEAAYESALAVEHPSPGADPAVVTDGMILSAVQAFTPPSP